MAYIVFPNSATEQGHAFEDLILSFYRKSGLYAVREWSGYFHGASGQWWQCDGIVENSQGRYLVEAKFFRDRPAKMSDIDPARRQNAAQDMNCTGLLYISLNGFAPDILNWPHDSKFEVQFYSWADLRPTLLATLSHYSSVLLDQFELLPHQALSVQHEASLYYDFLTPPQSSPQFPEFVTVPDSLELWLRRMPGLPIQLAQNSTGRFHYDVFSQRVTLIPDLATDLSLQEAWAIQDAISGYASRTYNAVRATAEALSKMKDGLITDIQSELHTKNWNTGVSGVRSSLDFLVLIGLVRKWLDQRKARYTLTHLGKAYTMGGEANDDFFAAILKNWLPYRAICQAIEGRGILATADDIITYFKAQYAPYEPYARSLFNPNKVDGLLRLYKQFRS